MSPVYFVTQLRSTLRRSAPGARKEVGRRFSAVSHIGVGKEAFKANAAMLARCGFTLHASRNEYIAAWSEELERLLSEQVGIEASVHTRRPFGPAEESEPK